MLKIIIACKTYSQLIISQVLKTKASASINYIKYTNYIVILFDQFNASRIIIWIIS